MDAINPIDRLNYIHEVGELISKNVRSMMVLTKPSRGTEKRVSQWEEIMRKFSEVHKEECKTVSVDIPRATRSTKQFPTGSKYEGTWDVLGMSGYGTYTFPNGVIYEGEFDDGMFHGEGELRYPSGAILQGRWRKGTMLERNLIFADGLEYAEEDWLYCRMPDRRFTVEHNHGLQPAGQSYLTAEQPTREVPAGYYDAGDGFYDPKTKMVYSADDITAIIRSPSAQEQKWIVDNCRTSPDVPLGPRPDLYEQWSEPLLEGQQTPDSRLLSYVGSYMLDQDEDLCELNHSSSQATGRWNSRPFIKFNSSNYEPEKSSVCNMHERRSVRKK